MADTSKKTDKMDEVGISIPFRFHPRVFAALGADLVTSDLVAVIELVKNSYDAFAPRVDVRFLRDDFGKLYLEIEDGGLGMDDKIIENVWCMVATPFREQNPTSERQVNGKKKERRVSGAKGLGRLSVARLGGKLELFTKQKGEKAWKVTVEWDALADAKTLDQCAAIMRPALASEFSVDSGTLLRITQLRSNWPENEIDELAEGLSRLKPPFKQLGDFKIFLTDTRNSERAIEIETSEFINKPVYCIKGKFSATGLLTYDYNYQPYAGKNRPDSGEKKWQYILEDWKNMRVNSPSRYVPTGEKPLCGPFEFEIRAWDLDPDSILQASKKFQLGKSVLRSEIRTFKGISVYRDQVLVLPKSESARDWLGLDLRRVSKVGTRISTSQIVGFVGITADGNPDIVDTSDRERLTRNDSVREFERVLQYIIELLENERDEDRPREEVKVGDLFQDIDAGPVILEAQQMVKDKAEAAEILPALEKFGERLQQAKSRIERTFGYYNRLATIGTLSQMLVHEVGNNNLIIGHFMATARAYLEAPEKNKAMFVKHLAGAEIALQALERLADRFIPLASQGFKRARRQSSIKEAVETCRQAREKDLERFDIDFETHLATADQVKVDPGELHAVFLNLVDNAIYWLSQNEGRKRHLRIVSRRSGADRIECKVLDSGPGIDKGDEDKIFLPGVTKRPNGFGMGLTVIAEIIEGHSGKIHVESPGDLKGATFVFDLPLTS
jgi:signal transduction histidine kinase